jgi:hypothetical protein
LWLRWGRVAAAEQYQEPGGAPMVRCPDEATVRTRTARRTRFCGSRVTTLIVRGSGTAQRSWLECTQLSCEPTGPLLSVCEDAVPDAHCAASHGASSARCGLLPPPEE